MVFANARQQISLLSANGAAESHNSILSGQNIKYMYNIKKVFIHFYFVFVDFIGR
jgi:hypothetical protein